PRQASKVPHARVHDARIARIDGDVAGTARRSEVEGLAPRLAAVEGHEDPAIRRVLERIAEGAHHDVARVSRIDRDPRDAPNAGEADPPPGLGRVGRLVEPVAVANVVA